MYRARSAALVLLAAGLTACDLGDARHNYPDEEGSRAASQPGATLNDSLATGEAIQTVPPPVEGAQPTSVATGDTLGGAAGDTTPRP
ncbi:MAG TPA: hypothetical protein VFQ76_05100 [Longimicrobiaceae bacterium]|nr:hypothetical protein [Longimicrobiaceae bacterium]